jgi:hypothetical protein
VAQALASFYVLKAFSADGREARFDEQLQVISGRLPAEDYMKRSVGFFEPSRYLNEVAKGGRVALYDEVFGYLLDVPYFWANPGHTTELGYERMTSGADLWKALRDKGITHVYVNLRPAGTDVNDANYRKWIATLGLEGPPQPYTDTEKAEIMSSPDLNRRQKLVLGEAIASGWLTDPKRFGASRIVYRVSDHEPPRKM